jgi:hypothetical protein
MKAVLYTFVIAAGVFLTAGRAAEPDPKAVFFTLPDKIDWKIGAGSDNATLQGDPSKPGLYVQLTRWHPHNMSRPHSHSTERYIMVLSGTWWIGTGATYDPDSTYPVPAGTWVVDRASQLHYDGAKDTECVLEIVGMGPMTTTQAGGK